jgi:TetR/AcrR family transcriptional regulator, transcriptional repressor for nem operon
MHTGRYAIPTMVTRQRDQTRHRLLDAAFAEIHRHGFQAASVADILADTGLTKGALYHHFPDKKSLGLAVVDEIIGKRMADLFVQPLMTAERPVQALLDLLEEKSRQPEASLRLGCPLNNLMQEMSPVDEDFRTHLHRILVSWQTTFEKALRRAQAAGELRPEVDCRAAALFIVAAWEGCVGVAKNMQSVAGFSGCMGQLQSYVTSLLADSSAA